MRALAPGELAAAQPDWKHCWEKEYLREGLAIRRWWRECGPAMPIFCSSIAGMRTDSCSDSIAGGLIVRDLRAHPALPHSLRVSVGTRAQNDALAAQRGSRMSARRILFLDRDGTLNEEVADEQIDSLSKVRLMPGVIPALFELKRAGFVFVMVTNQDGLGTPSFPRESFDARIALSWTCSAPRGSNSKRCFSVRISSARMLLPQAQDSAWSGIFWRRTTSTRRTAS